MKRRTRDPDSEKSLHAVAGVLASGVAGQLSGPLRELRESLEVVVDTIDHHVNESPGPTPYPWKSLQSLRQELADAYLLSRTLTRLASDLQENVADVGGAVREVDVNKLIEAALNLARHRLDAEIFVDLGSIPAVQAVAGEFVLAMAELLLCCAESTTARAGSAISIKTYRDRDPDMVVIAIADNGDGAPDTAHSAASLVGPMIQYLGGSFDGVSEIGQGTVFECRLPIPP